MPIGRQCIPSLGLLRASEVRSVRAVRAWRANVKSGTAFRLVGATLHRAECLLHIRSNASVLSVGQWSRVAGRGLRVDGRWSMAAGRGSRVAGRGSVARVPRYGRAERLLLRRRSDSVRGTVFHVVSGIGPPPFPMRGPMSIDGLSDIERSPVCAIVRQRIPSLDLLRASAARPFARERGAISWVRARRDLLHATLRSKSVHVFGRPCASVALVPHCRRAEERLLCRHSGGVARLPCHQRHVGQYHF